MDVEEYREKVKAIEEQADRAKRQVAREFALSNNTVRFGDMVEDHNGRIKVESIKTVHGDLPKCAYEGPEYTKTGTPFKNGRRRVIYQNNLRT